MSPGPRLEILVCVVLALAMSTSRADEPPAIRATVEVVEQTLLIGSLDELTLRDAAFLRQVLALPGTSLVLDDGGRPVIRIEFDQFDPITLKRLRFSQIPNRQELVSMLVAFRDLKTHVEGEVIWVWGTQSRIREFAERLSLREDKDRSDKDRSPERQSQEQ